MHYSVPHKDILWKLLCLLRDLHIISVDRMYEAYDTTWKREHK